LKKIPNTRVWPRGKTTTPNTSINLGRGPWHEETHDLNGWILALENSKLVFLPQILPGGLTLEADRIKAPTDLNEVFANFSMTKSHL